MIKKPPRKCYWDIKFNESKCWDEQNKKCSLKFSAAMSLMSDTDLHNTGHIVNVHTMSGRRWISPLLPLLCRWTAVNSMHCRGPQGRVRSTQHSRPIRIESHFHFIDRICDRLAWSPFTLALAVKKNVESNIPFVLCQLYYTLYTLKLNYMFGDDAAQ